MSTVLTKTASLHFTPNGGGEPVYVPHLFCVLEGGCPLRPASRHALDNVDEVVLGRGARRGHERTSRAGQAQLAIALPDRWLSSRHAAIVRDGDGFVFRDLGSKNGSRINGAPIDSAPLYDGDIIEIGQTFLVFRARVALPETEPRDFTIAADQTLAGLGTLHAMLNVQFSDLGRISGTDLPVAVLGETGTGKELVARAIHEMSRRRGNFVAVNCGAIPKDLAPSELFGFKKGAFSGAISDRVGLIKSAEGGTLFLDEIGDLPLDQQAVLLRVLQDRHVMPVGGNEPRQVDFRVIVATHHDIAAAVEAGRFRDDLWARVSGFVLRLPPLRERREDLALIVGAMLARLDHEGAARTTLRSDAALALLRYDWPRNIRELEQALRAALALCEGDCITLANLPEWLRAPATAAAPPAAAPRPPDTDPGELLDEQRHAHLHRLLERTSGNLSEVARLMGKGRTQIQRWIKRYGIDLDRYRPSQR